jgi:outer membrane receptor for ferrienterochelin and colicins
MSKNILKTMVLVLALAPCLLFSQEADEPENPLGTDSMDQVVITGTMRAVKRSASPVPVEVYTPKFFMKNPSPAIFDALQLVNGVRPQLNCNICNTGDIHINGLEGPYTMILIDGMPIVSSLSTVYGLSGIPTSLVERVEVVKGPASSLYGSEAIGGLINVITKSPAKAPQLAVDISGTSWHEFNGDIGLKYNAGASATGLFGFNYFNFSKPTDNNHDHFTDVTLQDRFSLFNKISFKRKNERIASIAARYVYEDRWGGEMNWNKQFRGGDSVYGESIYTSRVEMIGNYQLPVKEKLMFSYSVNRHDQNSAYGQTIFNATQEVAFGQLTWEKMIGRGNALLTGLVGRYTWYNDNTTATYDTLNRQDKADKVLIPGVFVQDEITLNSKQQLLMGARYDYDYRHGNIFTPRVAYKLSPTPKDIIRINAGTGFRVVNIFTEDHAALTGARAVVIAEELKPERSYNANISYLKKIYARSHWMNFDISAWYTHFSNRIVPDYLTNANQIIYRNLNGYSVSKGLTVNAEYGNAKSLVITMGATFMDVSITDKSDGKTTRSRQLLTEKWSGTWTVSYKEPVTAITIDYTGNIYGPMLLPLLSPEDPRPEKSPAWSIQNIQLSGKIATRLEIYAGVKNLLNWTPAKRVPFLIARANDPFDKHLDVDNPYHLTFDPNYVYAPNQGIKAFLGFRYAVH